MAEAATKETIANLFDAPLTILSPAAIDIAMRKETVEAARDRVEIEMAASGTRFRHPNDLILLAVAEKGLNNPPESASET